jgi:hypothetical protein
LATFIIMKWILAALVLCAVAWMLRRLLQMGEPENARRRGIMALTPEREAIYRHAALEIETQSAILSISLNDAIEERDSAHDEVAWRLVQLCISEWERLGNVITGLLNVTAKYLEQVRIVVPVRAMGSHHFKTRVMIDYVRMHELLDQLVFSSKRRFQLHLRVLRRAAETLTAECFRTCREAENVAAQTQELWQRLDLYFHDFDLTIKEALLAFRILLVCLPHPALGELEADVKAVVSRSVRTTPMAAGMS